MLLLIKNIFWFQTSDWPANCNTLHFKTEAPCIVSLDMCFHFDCLWTSNLPSKCVCPLASSSSSWVRENLPKVPRKRWGHGKEGVCFQHEFQTSASDHPGLSVPSCQVLAYPFLAQSALLAEWVHPGVGGVGGCAESSLSSPSSEQTWRSCSEEPRVFERIQEPSTLLGKKHL